MAETTVLGATLAAGKGVGLWRDLNLVVNPSSNKFYYPRNSHVGKIIICTCMLTEAHGT